MTRGEDIKLTDSGHWTYSDTDEDLATVEGEPAVIQAITVGALRAATAHRGESITATSVANLVTDIQRTLEDIDGIGEVRTVEATDVDAPNNSVTVNIETTHTALERPIQLT